MPRYASKSGRTTAQLDALIVRHLHAEPATWSAESLAGELGEEPRRVRRTVERLRGAGWGIAVDDPGQRLTLTEAPPLQTIAFTPDYSRFQASDLGTLPPVAPALDLERRVAEYRAGIARISTAPEISVEARRAALDALGRAVARGLARL